MISRRFQGEYLEQFEKQSRGGLRGHKCEPEDIMGKEAKKKRDDQEKLKKKNYELEKLKEVRMSEIMFHRNGVDSQWKPGLIGEPISDEFASAWGELKFSLLLVGGRESTEKIRKFC